MSPVAAPERRLVTWIADLGLGSVVPVLRRVDALDPDALRALISAVGPPARRARDSADTASALARRLASAWSAAGPARHLAAIADAAAQFADQLAGTARRWAAAADEIDRLTVALSGAVQRANAGADWSPGYVEQGTPEGRQRTQVATELAGAVAEAGRRLDALLAGLLAAAPHADPGAALRALRSARAGTPLGWSPLVAPSAAAPLDTTTRERLRADLASTDPHRQQFAAGVLQALQSVEKQGGPAQLLVYDPDAFGGQGRVAIALGDVAAADHVAVLTPGIGNAPSAMAGTVPQAGALTAAARADPGSSTAVVLWFGYDIPVSAVADVAAARGAATDPADLLAAADTRAADAGGDLLAADLAVLRPLLRRSATLTLVGHSMGSVVTARALQHPVDVDSAVLLGSPGTGLQRGRADQLIGVRPENLFVVRYDQDPVTWDAVDLGAAVVSGLARGPRLPADADGFGTDPAEAAFGAQVVDAPDPLGDGAVPILGGTARVPSIAHHQLPNYLSGAALVAVGAVTAGRTARTPRRPGRG